MTFKRGRCFCIMSHSLGEKTAERRTQKNSHCNAWLLSSSSLKPKTSSLSANLRRYSSSADVSMTGKGGDFVWSRRTGMRPLGFRRKNQSFFCSLVMMLLEVVSGSSVRRGEAGGVKST